MEIALAKTKNENSDDQENIESDESENSEGENIQSDDIAAENEAHQDIETENEAHQDIEGQMRRNDEQKNEIEVSAQGSLNETEIHNLKKIKIKIHGSLKKPIMALNLYDLMEDLQKLRENPDEYLSPTPLYYSCFPLSGFLNREAIEFNDDLQNDQLRDVYKLKEDFQVQFKHINSLLHFAHDVSLKKESASEDLPFVIDELETIKQSFHDEFKEMQKEWMEMMARKFLKFHNII